MDSYLQQRSPTRLNQEEYVSGLAGRKKLTRQEESLRWMDKQRENIHAYEYLCHVGEAKEWIEQCIDEELPPVTEFEESLRNGVALAKVTKRFCPDLVRRIFEHPRLQFRHSENINYFFQLLHQVGMPDLFTFELTDLYDGKNIPKVIYCIHALAYMLAVGGLAPNVGSLVGKLEFSNEELQKTQRGLDASGLNMPNFGSLGNHFGQKPKQKSLEEQIAEELEAADGDIERFQAKARANRVRAHYKTLKSELLCCERDITLLQSVVRAKRLRARVTDLVVDLKFDRFLARIPSIMMGNHIRDKMNALKNLMELEEDSVLELQSIARGSMTRAAIKRRMSLFSSATTSHSTETRPKGSLEDLQCIAVGGLVRKRIDRLKFELSLTEPQIAVLQGIVRGNATRRDALEIADFMNEESSNIITIQSCIRGLLLRKKFDNRTQLMSEVEQNITQLQALIRSRRVQNRVQKLRLAIAGDWEANDAVVEFQSACRGYLVRRARSRSAAKLIASCDKTIQLQSIIRANKIRAAIREDLDRLDLLSSSIVRLQSKIRGILTRFEMDLLLEDLEMNAESIIELQSIIRGNRVKKSYDGKMRHFQKNMGSVIKIQSYIRAKQQGDAYKALTNSTNPPLSVVRSFVHLLNDSELDFEEEIQLENDRKRVIDEVQRNESLEEYITQMDVKIALLLKNKITLDDLVKHRNNGYSAVSQIGVDASMFDLKALNKASRRRLELYQGLFYILQTQPVYLSNLFAVIQRNRIMSETELRDLHQLSIKIFGGSSKSLNPREEYFLVKLISYSASQQLLACSSSREFLRSPPQSMWKQFLIDISRSQKRMSKLRQLLGEVVNRVVEESDDRSNTPLSLDSDPLTIYRDSVSREEMATGRLSTRPVDVPVDEAIQDPETRQQFVKNLQNLRLFTTLIVERFEEAAEDLLPFSVKWAAKEVFKNACLKFSTKESESKLYAVVGHVIITSFISPIIGAADEFGLSDQSLSPLAQKNLAEIGKMLGQISSMRQFSAKDNVYLQPLNEFVKQMIQRMKLSFKKIIENVQDPESEYDSSIMKDLTQRKRPVLFIKTADIFSVHKLVFSQISNILPEPKADRPSDANPLMETFRQLGSLPNDASEILNIAKFTEIKLDLNPSYCQVEDADELEVNSLIMSVKRCLLYILRVQTGVDLMDILVAPVSEQDEIKYRALLREEKMEREKRNVDGGNNNHNELSNSAAEWSGLSYRELKLVGLEKILELESYGKISRENNYQDILNSLANDIKSKGNRRVARAKEIKGIRETLNDLAEKEKYLKTQLETYNSYIEQAMQTLQQKNKPGKKLRFPIFSKQYFHNRDLQRSGKLPPKFGSYKYSASSLFDKGVLVELQGYSERQYHQVNFTFSSDSVGVFCIEATFNNVALPGASVQLSLDELLGQQYNNKQYIDLFDGMVKLNTNLTLHFIFKKFYGEG